MSQYKTISLSPTTPGVVRITIHNGDSNLWDWNLMEEMANALESLGDDVKVVIFSSNNPYFFIAHYDLRQSGPDGPSIDEQVSVTFHKILFKILKSPIIFIAEVDGIARGMGSEFALHCDMRFAGRAKTRLAHPECRIGIMPGAGGVQHLVEQIGRARAFEYILTGYEVDADTAERISWINRAFDSRELSEKVDEIAKRIALFPKSALSASKDSINAASCPKEADTLRDSVTFFNLIKGEEHQTLVRKMYEVTKGLDYKNGPVDDGTVIKALYGE
ncbi:hypothetical protein CEP51_013645 [Fusarium floridanum]|uniref:Enoyl-CoA hydratase n=1 Tax=Fusarium floridanum TaxID=1325733 RepID=A0A428Q7T7_9HYPO|nr:hypothetical protein CEP51_013645 [Fusarium floridanum]